MSSTIFDGIATQGHGVGVFTDPEKITVFPEFDYLKSPPECDGRYGLQIKEYSSKYIVMESDQISPWTNSRHQCFT